MASAQRKLVADLITHSKDNGTNHVSEDNSIGDFAQQFTCIKHPDIPELAQQKPLLVIPFNPAYYSPGMGYDDAKNCLLGSEFYLLYQNLNTPQVEALVQQNRYSIIVIFDATDFDAFGEQNPAKLPLATDAGNTPIIGTVEEQLSTCLCQFWDWASHSPASLWGPRRQEILQLLLHLGFAQIRHFMPQGLSEKIRHLIRHHLPDELNANEVCRQMAMSESTLRRKLLRENTSLQQLKDQVRLHQALHLLQTTAAPVNSIAADCGYSSHSRFTERFTTLFGVNPSSIRRA